MNPFALVQPRTMEEALELLDTDDPSVRPFAGGTALMLMMKSKLFQPATLISLNLLSSGLKGIRVVDDALHVGPMTSLREMELSSTVREFNPVISEAMKTLSNVRVRNVATLGGHIAHADPHMDLPPILIALGAELEITNRSGVKTVPIEEFITGYYSTTLQPGDLITDVIVPAIPDGLSGAYYKFTSISADDWPTVGAAAFVKMVDGQVADARITVSAATEKPTRFASAEQLLIGKSPTEELFRQVADTVAHSVQTLADIRGSAAYKREMVGVFVHKAIATASARAVYEGGIVS